MPGHGKGKGNGKKGGGGAISIMVPSGASIAPVGNAGISINSNS